MTIERELGQLIERPGTIVFAFEPNGARSVPLPAVLAPFSADTFDVDTPLDALAPESRGQAIIAFQDARQSGRGSATVRLAGSDDTRRLEIFDLEPSHGCFVAVLMAGDDQEPLDGVHTVLPPLRATYELNVTGMIESISAEFTAMLGWGDGDAVGRSSLDFIHPDDHEAGIVAWVELLKRPQTETRLRQRFMTASGQWLWCEVTDHNLLDGPEACVFGELVDISREMATHAALEQRERLLDRLSRALPTGVFHVDADGVASVCNDRWEELTGLGQDDGIDAVVANLADPEAVAGAMVDAIADGIDADLDVAFVAGSGSCAFGTLHLRPFREHDRHIALLVTLDDVTSLRTYQHQLTDQARRDPLTGIHNRLGIEEVLEARLAEAASDRLDDAGLTVLFVDLDRFKRINDTSGHAIGDEVLRRVATGIQGLLRSDDVVARIGGDEFLVVLGPTTSARADALVERMAAALPPIAETIPAEVTIGASIGLAVAGPDDDFDSLVRRADQAMYEVKRERGVERSASEHR